MSLLVNLSNRDLKDAYDNIVNQRGIEWVVYTYEGGTNDLKVQSTGNGGLEELQEEFSDGRCGNLSGSSPRADGVLHFHRIQYAFVRVQDPNVNRLL